MYPGRTPTIAGRVAGRSLYFAAVNAEFNWWLLIVGLVVGAGLVWFVVLDSRRRETDIDADEREREAVWLSAVLADEGWDVPPEATTRLLELHRRYLEAPPPDEPTADAEVDVEEVTPAATVAPAAHAPIEPEVDPTGIDAPGADGSAPAAGTGSELPDEDGVRIERGAVDARQ